ncbi:hypothetical protein D3C73_1015100 [compost metagenome]
MQLRILRAYRALAGHHGGNARAAQLEAVGVVTALGVAGHDHFQHQPVAAQYLAAPEAIPLQRHAHAEHRAVEVVQFVLARRVHLAAVHAFELFSPHAAARIPDLKLAFGGAVAPELEVQAGHQQA